MRAKLGVFILSVFLVLGFNAYSQDLKLDCGYCNNEIVKTSVSSCACHLPVVEKKIKKKRVVKKDTALKSSSELVVRKENNNNRNNTIIVIPILYGSVKDRGNVINSEKRNERLDEKNKVALLNKKEKTVRNKKQNKVSSTLIENQNKTNVVFASIFYGRYKTNYNTLEGSAYIESEMVNLRVRNERTYRKYGFNILGELSVIGTPSKSFLKTPKETYLYELGAEGEYSPVGSMSLNLGGGYKTIQSVYFNDSYGLVLSKLGSAFLRFGGNVAITNDLALKLSLLRLMHVKTKDISAESSNTLRAGLKYRIGRKLGPLTETNIVLDISHSSQVTKQIHLNNSQSDSRRSTVNSKHKEVMVGLEIGF